MKKTIDYNLGNTQDLTGEIFGSWKVVGFCHRLVHAYGIYFYYWKVQCQVCGEEKSLEASYLRNKPHQCKSCIDNTPKQPRNDVIGEVFGIWKIIAYSHTQKRAGLGQRKHKVRCVHIAECTNCGVQTTDLVSNIRRRGKKWSCRNCHGLPPGTAGATRLFEEYVKSAKVNARVFELTFEQFRDITSQNCHYCGAKPELVRRSGGKESRKESNAWRDYPFNGIDRKDNTIGGYTLNNCVPCCRFCNLGKHNLSYEWMIEHMAAFIRRITQGEFNAKWSDIRFRLGK